jgi:DNA adenine methylase
MDASLKLQDDRLMVDPTPFVKWAGGKRQLLNQLIQNTPPEFNNYYEPFLGGGALFFKLFALGKIKKAYLNDSNKILIDSYKTIKEHPGKLVAELKSGEYKNDKETFLKIRAEHPENIIKATARFLYLNKTAFNGLYRVNSKGGFNVPFGKYSNPKIVDEKNILAVNKASAVKSADKKDFVYFDPPYAPLNKTSSFTSYTKEDFGEKDQERLAKTVKTLDNKGCLVMVSNSYTPLIQELYNGYNQQVVMASRAINCKGDSRGKIKELIITNYHVSGRP